MTFQSEYMRAFAGGVRTNEEWFKIQAKRFHDNVLVLQLSLPKSVIKGLVY